MPFSYRSPRLKTLLGSFGFFHVFRGGKSSRSSAGPSRPENRCSQCGYTWTPRGRNASLRCPSCGVKFDSVTYADSPDGPTAASVVGGLLGCLTVIGVASFAMCGGCIYVLESGALLSPAAGPAPTPRRPAEHSSARATPPKRSADGEPREAPPSLPASEPAPAPSAARTWVSADGTFSTVAEFGGAIGSQVTLKKTDGTVVKVQLEQLSTADQEWIRELARAKGG